MAVIGAGFSGVLTALRLVGAPDGPCVRLVERRARFAQGAAYSTTSPRHLLNVRAANMSAFPETPDHFLQWLAEEGREVVDGAFVTRATFGEYLQALLREAAACPEAAGRLMLEGDEAVAVERQGGDWRVRLAMGRSFAADAVVLALGNLPPHAPAAMDAAARASSAYVADPWAMDAEEAPQSGTALLLGTGLTMVDVALSLNAARPALKMLALSRRGLGPRRHTLEREPPMVMETPRGSPSQVLRWLRASGGGPHWRAAMDGVRPHVQAIWRSWSLAERRGFLRHARPWWDIHRHRLAPPVASAIDHLTASGALSTAAGAVERITPEGAGEGGCWSSGVLARGRPPSERRSTCWSTAPGRTAIWRLRARLWSRRSRAQA